jgi:hypothetical protein
VGRLLALVSALLGLGLLLGAGCTSRTRSRCDAICAREAECAEELRLEIDRAECIEACLALERSDKGRAQVDRHAACVLRAEGCPAVLACE